MKVHEILNEESTEVREMMLKLRKNSTGFLNPSKLAMVLGALKGWAIEKQTFVTPTDYINSDEEKDIGTYTKHVIGRGPGNYKDKMVISCVHNAWRDAKITDADRELIDGIHKTLSTKAKQSVPAKPKAGTYYYSDVSEPKFSKENYGETYGFTFKAKFVSAGYLVTAPNGKTCELKKEPNSNSISMGNFLRWSKEDTSFDQDILDALGMESHEASKKAARTRENTGTCPCCFGEYKLVNERMVHHGYERPGHGYIVGDCFGVKYKPFEKSSEGTEKYQKMLKDLLDNEKQRLKTLKSGKVTRLSKGFGSKTTVIDQGHADWDKTLKGAISALEKQVEYIQEDIDRLQKKITNWKEEDLPWERLNKAKAK